MARRLTSPVVITSCRLHVFLKGDIIIVATLLAITLTRKWINVAANFFMISYPNSILSTNSHINKYTQIIMVGYFEDQTQVVATTLFFYFFYFFGSHDKEYSSFRF